MNPPSEISIWLESVGLGEFAPVFEANEVTPDLLVHVTSDYLSAIGIASQSHRNFILAAIAERQAAASVPASTDPQFVALETSSHQPNATTDIQMEDAAGQQALPSVAPPRTRRGIFSRLGGRKAFSGRFMIVSVAVHLILFVGAAFWVVQKSEVKRKLQFANGAPTIDPSKRALEHRVSLNQKKNAGGSPAQAQRIAVAGLASKITLPDMPTVPTTSTQFVANRMAGMGGAGFGTGMGFGNGSGNGIGGTGGGGKLFVMMPQAMSKRCSKADRLQRLKDNGGTPACEEAVVKALRWMKKTQNSDGSWGSGNNVAMTGLALMAYFGHCETPISPEFGESCAKGITYLVNEGMKGGGKLGGDMSAQSFCYEHAIGTYALGEATTFCKEIKFNVPNLFEITQKAGQFIIEHQNSNGGWAYNYARTGGHTDVSIVGWQMQALKSCSHTGLEFEGLEDCVTKGLEFLTTMQAESGAFGYKSRPGKKEEAAHHSLTGVGMLCFQMWGQGKSSIVRNAAKHTLETTKFDFKKEADIYAHYYESQAMLQRSSSEWKRYNDMFRDQLLNNQNADGSWEIPAGAIHVKNKHFSTCLCTLMLEVYYRFLSTGGATGGRGKFGF